MPAIPSYKKIVQMLDKFKNEGETISLATFLGRFRKYIIATTSQKRLLITTLPFFGSNSKILNSIPFTDISKMDIFPTRSGGYFTVETSRGEKYLWRVPGAGLFDTFEKIYKIITSHNPSARPSYLSSDEKVIFMAKTSDGVLKLTEVNVFLLEANKKTGEILLKRKLSIEDIECVDFYSGKMTASFVYLRVDGEELLLEIGYTLTGFVSASEKIFAKGSSVVAERFYRNIIKLRSSAKPDYMDEGEEMLATVRVGHSRMSVSGCSFLRATESRFLELIEGKNGRLTVKEEIPLCNIESGKLKIFGSEMPENYELVIKTAAKKYKFVDTDYNDAAMERMLNLINES